MLLLIDQNSWVSASSSYSTTQHLTALPIPKVDSSSIRASWSAGSPELAFTSSHKSQPYLERCYINCPGLEISLLSDMREIEELKQRTPGFSAKLNSKSLNKFGRGIKIIYSLKLYLHLSDQFGNIHGYGNIRIN